MICIAFNLQAQDISVINHYKFISLRPASTNTAAPDYERIQPDLEAGIKALLKTYKIPILKSKEEASEKEIKKCDILICTYNIHYATGMMFNATITCALHFTTCDDKDIISLNGKRSLPAVVTAKGYLKEFTTLLKPFSNYVYEYKGG